MSIDVSARHAGEGRHPRQAARARVSWSTLVEYGAQSLRTLPIVDAGLRRHDGGLETRP